MEVINDQPWSRDRSAQQQPSEHTALQAAEQQIQLIHASRGRHTGEHAPPAGYITQLQHTLTDNRTWTSTTLSPQVASLSGSDGRSPKQRCQSVCTRPAAQQEIKDHTAVTTPQHKYISSICNNIMFDHSDANIKNSILSLFMI